MTVPLDAVGRATGPVHRSWTVLGLLRPLRTNGADAAFARPVPHGDELAVTAWREDGRAAIGDAVAGPLTPER
ncbi:hypothetical protein [Umezawaea beigongshangensis]|uniref:hypothetical protein n=1 Tax=Umezawaea beigongshangensis TaxID=2780383 RepID=UPI0018F16685|nr:hypothetical protein [Umezawaea beigongshangensis]